MSEPKDYSVVYRLLHWSIAICMILLLGTIFLRLTWMNRENVADIIQDYFSANPNTLTRDEMVLLAKKIRKPMWEWHIYLGYVITGLFSLRMILPLFGEMKFANPFNPELKPLVKFKLWVYIVFYCCLAVSLTTGLIIEFGPETMEETMEEIHELSIYYLVSYMVLHLGGVLFAEFSDDQGIISRIVSGKRKSEG
jgi:cytochrome b561